MIPTAEAIDGIRACMRDLREDIREIRIRLDKLEGDIYKLKESFNNEQKKDILPKKESTRSSKIF